MMPLIEAVLHYGSQGATIIVAAYLLVFEYRVHHLGERLHRVQKRVASVESALMNARAHTEAPEARE